MPQCVRVHQVKQAALDLHIVPPRLKRNRQTVRRSINAAMCKSASSETGSVRSPHSAA